MMDEIKNRLKESNPSYLAQQVLSPRFKRLGDSRTEKLDKKVNRFLLELQASGGMVYSMDSFVSTNESGQNYFQVTIHYGIIEF